MCRIAAYIGPDAPLSSLLYDPPHSLQEQAYRPRELVHGNVNVDGTGVAWWAGAETRPLSYVTAASPWADPNLPDLAARLRGRTILAAVRSATPGIGVSAEHVSPFTSGNLAGAHNGRITGFNGPLGRDLLAELPDENWGEVGVLNDAKLLFLMAASRYSGELLPAVASALDDTSAIVRSHGESATLNLFVSDGVTVVAARHSVNAPLNSLYAASDGGSHLVASEPLDDAEAWKPVADHHLVAVTADSIQTRPLG